MAAAATTPGSATSGDGTSIDRALELMQCLDLPHLDAAYVTDFATPARKGRLLLHDGGTTSQIAALLWKPLVEVTRSWAATDVDGAWALPDAEREHLACMCEVAVLDACRGQGVGTNLILQAHSVMRHYGFYGAVLAVMDDNAGAIRLYKRLGYRIAHTFTYTPETKLHIMRIDFDRVPGDLPAKKRARVEGAEVVPTRGGRPRAVPAGRPRVVLLTGRAGSGKDTAAELLSARLEDAGVRCASVAFADALRDAALKMLRDVWAPGAELFWFTHRHMKNTPVVKLGTGDDTSSITLAGRELTPRWLLQWLGTDVMRNCVNGNVWLDATIERAAALLGSGEPPDVLFITDMRFPNEASPYVEEGLQRAGYGAVRRLRIVNPHAPPLGDDAHASETAIATLPVEMELENDKTLGTDAYAEALQAWFSE